MEATDLVASSILMSSCVVLTVRSVGLVRLLGIFDNVCNFFNFIYSLESFSSETFYISSTVSLILNSTTS